MTVFYVEEMHCAKCVERITKALTAAGLDFSVSPADKTVTVNGCDHCAQTSAAELEDLGFTAVRK